MSREPTNNHEYWEKRWEQQKTGWDIGYPSPAICKYTDQIPDKEISILIPGCGNAYEAVYLLERGFQNITLLDIVPSVVERLKHYFSGKPGVRILQEDFFLHEGQYHLILEQTFFCAIHPDLRQLYVTKTFQLLQDNGRLAGVLFDKSFPSPGPPYGGYFNDYMALFSKAFRIKTLASCYNSIPPRAGSEIFIIAEKQLSDEAIV